MQSTMMNEPLVLDRMLERAGRYFPNVEIVSRLPDKSLHRYTYADFYKRARALAEALQKNGIKKGDRVATLCWNHYVHLEAYFGIPACGGVLHTLNLRLHPNDIAYIVNHAEDRFLIVDDVLLPLFEQFKDQVNFEKIIVVPYSGQQVPDGLESYEDFLGQATGDFEYSEKDENDACGMCYTSGTTGRPKGVVYSHRSSVLHALGTAMPDAIGISRNDAVLPVVPMFHANAWGLPYSATMIGCKQVFPGPHMDADSLLEQFEQEQVTLAGGVPTIWSAILQALEANPGKWTLPAMRMVVGGSAVPMSMFKGFDKFNMNVVQGWGMTETSPLVSISSLRPEILAMPEEKQDEYRAKQGVPTAYAEVRVVSEAGEVPWDGETMGEIQVKGPWITGSYYKLDVTEDKFTADGWLRTGDVVTMDEYGYIKITDRTKDLIKSGGEWISSVDLENAIVGHPDVVEAAVIAIYHPKWEERPVACLVMRPGAEVDADALNNYLLDLGLAKFWLPDAYEVVEEIPHTSTGKINKLGLREQFKDYKLV